MSTGYCHQPGTVAYKDESWLREQYVDRARSLADLANEFGVDKGTITYWMDKFGIERRSVGKDADEDREYRDEAWLRQEYVEKQRSLESIREEMGVASKTAVEYWLDKHGIETRTPQEAGELMRGEDHPQWGGGQQDFRLTDEWQQLRKEVWSRDGYTCQECGATHCEVHAHHQTPVSEGGAKYDMDNLVTLCVECHIDCHSNGGEG